MKAAGDFLIEQNVLHRVQNVRIEADCEFTDMARAVVGIKNFVKTGSIIAGRFHNFSVLEAEFHIFKSDAVV
ncbi:hypothetical protein D3C80_1785640 [compost metagenome]